MTSIWRSLVFCFEINLVVENSIHEMNLHHDIHLKVKWLTLVFCFEITWNHVAFVVLFPQSHHNPTSSFDVFQILCWFNVHRSWSLHFCRQRPAFFQVTEAMLLRWSSQPSLSDLTKASSYRFASSLKRILCLSQFSCVVSIPSYSNEACSARCRKDAH